MLRLVEMSSGRVVDMLAMLFDDGGKPRICLLFPEVSCQPASFIVAAVLFAWWLWEINPWRFWAGDVIVGVKSFLDTSSLVAVFGNRSLNLVWFLILWTLDLRDFVLCVDGWSIAGRNCFLALSFVDDYSWWVWLDFALNYTCIIFKKFNIFFNFNFSGNFGRLDFFEWLALRFLFDCLCLVFFFEWSLFKLVGISSGRLTARCIQLVNGRLGWLYLFIRSNLLSLGYGQLFAFTLWNLGVFLGFGIKGFQLGKVFLDILDILKNNSKFWLHLSLIEIFLTHVLLQLRVYLFVHLFQLRFFYNASLQSLVVTLEYLVTFYYVLVFCLWIMTFW